ncbi:hypothetical protein CERSUDRAFT_100839 [Gelatoporia subvermispora B]|uniref:Uncharacterized protein n=1 Tax=Ceriporiopsis subvermispora (strain B) TaxID=914234 RepID=M2P6L8_CERS8|nr:hypothetical protein CERSUDRAFT_100839 [Gelatoporia subvermispora B]
MGRRGGGIRDRLDQQIDRVVEDAVKCLFGSHVLSILDSDADAAAVPNASHYPRFQVKSKPAAKGKGKAVAAKKNTGKGRSTSAGKKKADTQDVDEAEGNASSALSEVPSDVEVLQVVDVETDENDVLAEPGADEASESELKKKKDKPSKTALREKIQAMRKEVPPTDVIAQTPKPGGSRVPANTGGNSSATLSIIMRLVLTETVLYYHNILTSFRDLATPRYFDDFTDKVDNAAWNLRKPTGSRSQSSRTSTATSGTVTSSITASSATSTNSRASAKRTSRGQAKPPPPPSVVDEGESGCEVQAPAKKIKPAPSQDRQTHLSQKSRNSAQVNGTQARPKAPVSNISNTSARLPRVLDDDPPISTGSKPRRRLRISPPAARRLARTLHSRCPRFLQKLLLAPEVASIAEEDEDIDMDQEVPLRRPQQSKGVCIAFDSDDDMEDHQEQPRQNKGARISFGHDGIEDSHQERPMKNKGVRISFNNEDNVEDEHRPKYDFEEPQNPVTGHDYPNIVGYVSPYISRPKPYKLHKTTDPLNDLEEEVERQAAASSPIKRGSRVPATALLDFDDSSEEQDQAEEELVGNLRDYEESQDPNAFDYDDVQAEEEFVGNLRDYEGSQDPNAFDYDDVDMSQVADAWDGAFAPERDEEGEEEEERQWQEEQQRQRQQRKNEEEEEEEEEMMTERVYTKHLPHWIHGRKGVSWKMFTATYEKWVGCTSNPFDIDAALALEAMQDIYDYIYGHKHPRTLTLTDPIFKVAESRAGDYKHSFGACAHIMLEVYFELSNDGRNYHDMEERNKFSSTMLLQGQFLCDENHRTFENPEPEGAGKSVRVARPLAGQFKRTAAACEIPGWNNDAYLQGALALAMTAAYRAFRMYDLKRVMFVDHAHVDTAYIAMRPKDKRAPSITDLNFSGDNFGNYIRDATEEIKKLNGWKWENILRRAREEERKLRRNRTQPVDPVGMPVAREPTIPFHW